MISGLYRRVGILPAGYPLDSGRDGHASESRTVVPARA